MNKSLLGSPQHGWLGWVCHQKPPGGLCVRGSELGWSWKRQNGVKNGFDHCKWKRIYLMVHYLIWKWKYLSPLCSVFLYLEYNLKQYSNNLSLFLEILYILSTYQYFYQFAWVSCEPTYQISCRFIFLKCNSSLKWSVAKLFILMSIFCDIPVLKCTLLKSLSVSGWNDS